MLLDTFHQQDWAFWMEQSTWRKIRRPFSTFAPVGHLEIALVCYKKTTLEKRNPSAGQGHKGQDQNNTAVVKQ